MIIAEGIKKLYYVESSEIKADLTIETVKTLIESAKEITNVHQDTWSIEEAEATRTHIKNELTGGT